MDETTVINDEISDGIIDKTSDESEKKVPVTTVEDKPHGEGAPVENNGLDVTIDDLPGLAITLGEREAVWKLESGIIDLNRFTGNVSMKIPRETDEYDKLCIMEGLRYGRIEITDEVTRAFPAVKDPLIFMEPKYVRARRVLDESPIERFKAAIDTISSVVALNICLEVERSFDKRADYIKILTKRIGEIEA